jgi:hypothetical protein
MWSLDERNKARPAPNIPDCEFCGADWMARNHKDYKIKWACGTVFVEGKREQSHHCKSLQIREDVK